MAKTDELARPASHILTDAWREGRPIIPLVAAGFSASSGYPLTDQLTHYLARTSYFIRHDVHRWLFQWPRPSERSRSYAPAAYLTVHGWPTPNQLMLDLYNYFDDQDGDAWLHKQMELTLQDESAFSEYLKYVQEKSAERWGRGRWRVATAIQVVALRELYFTDRQVFEAVWKKVVDVECRPRADWSRLLMELSEGNLGLVDALFSQLGMRFLPGPSHTLMAQIVMRMGLQLILTTNFDPFLETALAREGIQHRVFNVGRDEVAPHHAVVRQGLSVVKLHGGAYGFRFGERINYSLDENTRSTLKSYIPDDAILLVIGFSGNERRMMELMRHLALATDRTALGRAPRIIWTHAEAKSRLAPTVAELQRILHPQFKYEPISDAGDFLLEWHQRATMTYPKSAVRYPVLPKRILPSPSDGRDGDSTKSLTDFEQPFLLFCNSLPCAATSGESVEDTMSEERLSGSQDGESPSIKMSRLVARRGGYDLIWIDLEEHHTVSGVVSDIIEKMRVFDADLPPLILPLDFTADDPIKDSYEQELNERLGKPIRYLDRAFKRGRYVLAFDSLESFGRLHTSHHGMPSGKKSDADGLSEQGRRTERRTKELIRFLRRLMRLDRITVDEKRELIDWYCCVAVDAPIARHGLLFDPYEDPGAPPEVLVSSPLIDLLAAEVNGFCRDGKWTNSPFHLRVDSTSTPSDQSPLPEGLSLVEELRQFVGMVAPHRVNKEERDLAARTAGELRRKIAKKVKEGFRTLPQHQPNGGAGCCLQFQSTTLLFLALVVIRRPRSYAMILDLAYAFRGRASKEAREAASTAAMISEASHYRGDRTGVGAKSHSQRLDQALDDLNGAVLRALGGSYYMQRELKEWTYKLLTDASHARALWRKATGETPLTTRIRLCRDRIYVLSFIIIVHSRLAAYYYRHVYSRSRDVTAFHEYLYHRVSALRYSKTLSNLLAFLKLGLSENDDTEDLRTTLMDIETACLALGFHEGVDFPLSRTACDANEHAARVASFRSGVDGVRLKMLRSLMNAIARDRQVVFTSSSADTWIAWFDQLSEDLDGIVGGCRDIATPYEGDIDRPWMSESPESEELIHCGLQCHISLLHLKAQLQRERREWGASIETSLQALTHLLVYTCRVPRSQLEKSHKLEAISGEPQVHWSGFMARLGMITSKLRKSKYEDNFLESKGDELVQEKFRSKFEDLWDHLKENLIGVDEIPEITQRQLANLVNQNSAFRAPYRSIVELLINMSACARHLGHDTLRYRTATSLLAFAEELVTDSADSPVGRWMKVTEESRQDQTIESLARELRREIEFERLRYDVEQPRLWEMGIRNCFGQTVNEPLERQCESLYLTIEDRIRRLPGIVPTSSREFMIRTCNLRILASTVLTHLGRFEDAAIALDRAESGLVLTHDHESFLYVLCQIARANALMKHADLLLNRKEPGERSNDEGRRAARQKLVEARATLGQAEGRLRGRRKNIGVWRRLYESQAQLEIEELLLLLNALEFGDRRELDEGLFLIKAWSYVRSGLDAVRGGWDCSMRHPPGAKAPRPVERRDRHPWIARWGQLLTAAYAVAIEFDTRLHHDNDVPAPVARRSRADVAHRAKRRLRQRSKLITKLDVTLKRWGVVNRAAGLQVFVDHFEEKQLPLCIEALKSIAVVLTAPGRLQSRPSRAQKANGQATGCFQIVLPGPDIKSASGESMGQVKVVFDESCERIKRPMSSRELLISFWEHFLVDPKIWTARVDDVLRESRDEIESTKGVAHLVRRGRRGAT